MEDSEKKAVVDALTDTLLKIEGGLNMLEAGKQIPAFRKITGVKDKISALRAFLITGRADFSKALEELAEDSA